MTTNHQTSSVLVRAARAATRPVTRPRHLQDCSELGERLRVLTESFATVQYQLVCASADLAESDLWAIDGFATPAHWLAAVADVESYTAREWIRIGRLLAELPQLAAAFEQRVLSYAKVRTLTRIATVDTQTELIELAEQVAASELTAVLARWMHHTWQPEAIDNYQRDRRSVRWRSEPDGMTTFTMRLTPHMAAMLISVLTMLVMRARPRRVTQGQWPSVAQQHADALEELLTDGTGNIDTEVVVHVRGDGCETDNGTPIPDTDVGSLIPGAFRLALIHDVDGNPVDATNRRRHPTTRQKRVVKERDRVCVDCGRSELLEYDHDPAFEQTGHTITRELKVRCAPCHHQRHTST